MFGIVLTEYIFNYICVHFDIQLHIEVLYYLSECKGLLLRFSITLKLFLDTGSCRMLELLVNTLSYIATC